MGIIRYYSVSSMEAWWEGSLGLCGVSHPTRLSPILMRGAYGPRRVCANVRVRTLLQVKIMNADRAFLSSAFDNF